MKLQKSQKKVILDDAFLLDENFKNLFQNMSTGYAFCKMIYNQKGEPIDFLYLDVNKSFERLTGRKNPIGKKLGEIFPKEKLVKTPIMQLFGKVATTGKSEQIEYFHTPMNIWLSLFIYCPKKGYFMTVFDDITDRKFMEQKLKESQEQYTNIVEQSNDGIVVMQDGIIMFLNKRMVEMLGHKVEDISGNHFLKYIAPKDKEMVFANYKARTQGKKVEDRYGFDLLTKDGASISVEANISVISVGGRKLFVAIIRDMTKAKEIEKMKSEFVTITSHQMRTPLTGVKWITELLLDNKAGELPQKQKDYLRVIQESNDRMIRLVGDLLSVSHIENTDKFNIVRKKQDLVKGLNQVLADHKDVIEEQKIKIVFEKDFPKSLLMKVDCEKMYLVFQNLLDNAIKYSGKNKTIRIGFEKRDGQAILSVKDQGIGIPKNQYHRVFERFFRADNVLTTYSGTGLGLYITKYIVERHDGKIWFKSQEGKGTTFFVSLPM